MSEPIGAPVVPCERCRPQYRLIEKAWERAIEKMKLEIAELEVVSGRRKNLIVKLDMEQSLLTLLLRECLELFRNRRFSFEIGVSELAERIRKQLGPPERCPETGFMDGTGRCCLPTGHAGDHAIDGNDLGDSVAPLGYP